MRLAASCVAALALAGCAQQDGSIISPVTSCAVATVGLGLLLADGDLSSDQRARGDFVYYPAGVANCAVDDAQWAAVRDAWDAL